MAWTAEEIATFRAHVAVHEAAHAVAGLEQGFVVTKIAMADDGSGSTAYASFDKPAWELMEEQPDAAAPVMLAGKCAETFILGGHITEGYLRDLEIVWSRDGCPEDREERMRILQPWVDRAREIVREKADAIETVSVALMTADHLSSEEIVELVRSADTAHRRLPDAIRKPRAQSR